MCSFVNPPGRNSADTLYLSSFAGSRARQGDRFGHGSGPPASLDLPLQCHVLIDVSVTARIGLLLQTLAYLRDLVGQHFIGVGGQRHGCAGQCDAAGRQHCRGGPAIRDVPPATTAVFSKTPSGAGDGGAAFLLLCWIVCANSCARSSRPRCEAGANWPAPKTRCDPTV